MKKTCLFSLLTILCANLFFPLGANSFNNSLQSIFISKNKSKEHQISLSGKFSHRKKMSFTNVTLYQGEGYLRALFIDNTKDIRIQITDESSFIFYEKIINNIETEWQFDTDHLLLNKKYTIKFIFPSGDYLFGYFWLQDY